MAQEADLKHHQSTEHDVYAPYHTTFHMAEFSALKTEVAEHIKATTSYLQYAIAIAGGVSAWLLKEAHGIPNSQNNSLLKLAWNIPLISVCLFGLLSLATYLRIGLIAKYLLKIENEYGREDLGWQKFFGGTFYTVSLIHVFAWIILILSAAYLSYYNGDWYFKFLIDSV